MFLKNKISDNCLIKLMYRLTDDLVTKVSIMLNTIIIMISSNKPVMSAIFLFKSLKAIIMIISNRNFFAFTFDSRLDLWTGSFSLTYRTYKQEPHDLPQLVCIYSMTYVHFIIRYNFYFNKITLVN